MKRLLLTLTALALAAGGFAQDFPAANRAMLKVKAQKKYLMLPVEDNADGANIQVIGKNSLVKTTLLRKTHGVDCRAEPPPRQLQAHHCM